MAEKVLPLPRVRPESAPSVPLVRAAVIAAAAMAAAGLAYVVARETPMFAVDRIEVTGAPVTVAAEVRDALAPVAGRSLVGLDGAGLERRLVALSSVYEARYDRAFPHTLRIAVRPERPVAVLRRGDGAWVVSARGRVVRAAALGAAPGLPRIWLPAGADPAPGAVLADADGGLQARTLGSILSTGFVPRIRFVAVRDAAVSFGLRTGVELRLGRPVELRLKLTIARRILPSLPTGAYLDLTVPERPISGSNPQVEGRG